MTYERIILTQLRRQTAILGIYFRAKILENHPTPDPDFAQAATIDL